MVYEILTITVKVTYPDGSVKERRSTCERSDLDWAAQQYAEVNEATKVELIHNNEVLATYPKEPSNG
ncbi:hypothetical protein D3C85_1443800 [compost metagenome]